MQAAISCFASSGVRATSAEDIARQAGFARKTIYRLFGDRQSLIVAILVCRCVEAMAELRSELRHYSDFAESVVEGVLFAIRRLMADALFLELIASEATHGVGPILIVRDDVRREHERVWMPVYEAARAEGILVSPIANERLIDGQRAMAAMLMLRTDLDESGRREFLIDFFMPTLIGIEPAREMKRHG
jgi:AcrR family transcriptional regulator